MKQKSKIEEKSLEEAKRMKVTSAEEVNALKQELERGFQDRPDSSFSVSPGCASVL